MFGVCLEIIDIHCKILGLSRCWHFCSYFTNNSYLYIKCLNLRVFFRSKLRMSSHCMNS